MATRKEQMLAAIANRRAATGPPPKKHSAQARDAKHRARGRLPDGSTFCVRYSAASKTWSGTLEVLASDASPAYNAGHTADGVFRLLEELDIMYWEQVAALPDRHAEPAGHNQ